MSIGITFILFYLCFTSYLLLNNYLPIDVTYYLFIYLLLTYLPTDIYLLNSYLRFLYLINSYVYFYLLTYIFLILFMSYLPIDFLYLITYILLTYRLSLAYLQTYLQTLFTDLLTFTKLLTYKHYFHKEKSVKIKQNGLFK